MTEEQKQELLELLDTNEVDYWNLPQYAMVPDWFLRYWQLHNKVAVALGIEPYDYPEAAFHYNRINRQEEKEHLNGSEEH